MRSSGYVNAHTHIYSGLAPFGMPAPEPLPATFLQILERVWWRLDRGLDEPSLRAAARYYVANAARLDTTVLIDHHESPNFIEGSLDVLADACDEFGVRAVLCYGATERNGGRAEARRGLEECRRFLRENRRPGVRAVVGLHASFTVSDDTIREAGRLCRECGTVLHIHVAEDRHDVEDARRRGYDGVVQRLRALGALPPGSILAHGVHLTRDEVRQVDELACWLVQNPRSNHHNGVGFAAVLDEAARVALGTDGFPADMPAELQALADTAPTPADGAVDGIRASRLDNGWKLASAWFPDAETAPGLAARHTAPQTELDDIERDARREAARLWKRMP